MRIVAAVLALLLNACFIDIDLSGTSYQCSDGVCPPGYTCVGGMCVSNPDPGADAGIDGGVQPVACGKMTNLSDDFDDDDVDWGDIYTAAGTTVSQNGFIEITLPENPTEQAWGRLQSELSYDLRDSNLTIEVVGMVSGTAYANISLNPRNTLDELTLNTEEGSIQMLGSMGGKYPINEQVAYNPVNDRWWRLREESGTLYFETAPDGQNWTVRMSAPTPYYLAAVGVEISAGTSAGTTGNGSFVVDNLNINAPSPVWCKADAMTDSFDGVDLGIYWRKASAAGCTFTQNGDLTIDTAANEDCYLRTAARYDLTDSQVAVEVTRSLGDTAEGQISLYIFDYNSNDYVQLDQCYGEMYLYYCNSEGCPSAIYLNEFSQQHRWWRVSESEGSVDISTSPDGSTWTTAYTLVHGMDLSDVRIDLSVDSYGGVIAGAFDNYNVVP